MPRQKNSFTIAHILVTLAFLQKPTLVSKFNSHHFSQKNKKLRSKIQKIVKNLHGTFFKYKTEYCRSSRPRDRWRKNVHPIAIFIQSKNYIIFSVQNRAGAEIPSKSDKNFHLFKSHPLSLIMWANSMINLPSLYFWLNSNACS